MKKFTFLLSVLAVIFASCQDKTAYTVEGSFAEKTYEGKVVFLQTLDTTATMSPVVIDSATVKDGKFEFKGKLVESPVMGFISVGKLQDRQQNGEDKSPVGTIVLEPGTIKIGFENTLVNLSGTGTNDEFNKVHTILNKISNLYEEVAKAGSAEALPPDASGLDANARLEKLQKEMQDASFTFAKANIKNKVGEFLFISSGNTFKKEQVLELISLSDAKFQSKPEIQELQKKLSIKIPEVGQPFADVQIFDKDGKQVQLSAYVAKGKVVLIDFWASWCGPCIKEMPSLVKTYAANKSKGFEIVGLSVDEDQAAWLDAIKKNDMTWIQLIDAGSTAASTYGVNSIPHTVLVDKNGIIAAKELRGAELEAKVVELLK